MDERSAFLFKASKSIPDERGLQIVRSHLIWMSHAVAGRDEESKAFGPTTLCPHCSQMWVQGKFSLALKPYGAPGPRMTKLIRKQSTTPEKLTRIEQKLFQKFHTARNKLVLTCNFCNRDTEMVIKKPPVSQQEVPEEPEIIACESLKKKKKKKDRFAGLNASAVISASPSPGPKQNRTSVNLKQIPVAIETPVHKVHTPSGIGMQSTTASPVLSEAQGNPSPSDCQKMTPKDPKLRMRVLRNERRQEFEQKKKNKIEARAKLNKAKAKSSKLNMFLARNNRKELSMEDRISSLLQL